MSEASIAIDPGRHEAAGVAVSRMYERHARSLYGLCRMLLRDTHEAEDALQATFLAAHAALLRGGVPRDETAWIAAIARNECRGRIREKMKRPLDTGDAALETAPDPGPGPDERLADPDVKRALAQLPETQREAVVLHDVFGLRAREVGSVLGMSVPAVEALLFRGRRQLRLRLRPVHGVLVVPLAVREALGVAIPGFATSDAAAAVAGGAGIAGVGIIGKLVGAPAAVKVAAGVAAVATVGSVTAVETTRDRNGAPPSAVVSSGLASDPTGTSGSRSVSPGGDDSADHDRSSGAGHDDDGRAERSGSGHGDGRSADDDHSDERVSLDEGRAREDDGRSSGHESGTSSGSGPSDDDADRTRPDEVEPGRVGDSSEADARETSGSGSSHSDAPDELDERDSDGSGSVSDGSSGVSGGSPDEVDEPAEADEPETEPVSTTSG